MSRSVFSDSPDIPETIEGADKLINGTPSSCEIGELDRDIGVKTRNLHQPLHLQEESFHNLEDHGVTHHEEAEHRYEDTPRGDTGALRLVRAFSRHKPRRRQDQKAESLGAHNP